MSDALSVWLASYWWIAYLAIGCLVGFVAGLLGIGGGIVMVPFVVFVLNAQGFPPQHVLHVALGTALATIIFTSLSSVRAHHGYGAVDWPVARALAPGVLAGAFAAALLAGLIPTRPLAVLFTVLVFYVSSQMLLDVQPRSSRALPGKAGLFLAGSVIGGVSSLLSAGGAFISIPFLAWCQVPLRRAIGTAAAIGFPVALAGSAAYVLQGLRVADLPTATLGYVYLPALGLIVTTSMLMAPLGARLAHRLPVRRLRIIFGLLLFAMALRMLIALW